LARKSKAALQQVQVYHSLVECRILLQRCKQHADNAQKDGSSLAVEQQCSQLLAQLLQARHALMKRKESVDYEALVADDGGDEEEEGQSPLDDVIRSEYETCRDEWKSVLNKCHKDVQLHAGTLSATKFRVLDSSFWQQVESVTQYEESRRKDEDDAWDDAKVYQQLLKDFVAHNSQTRGASVPQQQLNRSSSKRSSKRPVVDRRASKGRKIRYTDIPKLANFTFPVSRKTTGQTLDESEFFKSLFGGVGNKPEQTAWRGGEP
jgi:hypothetical protein